MTYQVLDLFAGSGVGRAVKDRGLSEIGVETMKEAVETRDKNGLDTVLNVDGTGTSVSDIPSTFGVGIPILAGGPPCQTFSSAGNGVGRKALDRVLYGAGVVAQGETFRPDDGDPRTWLVLEPLRIILASRPRFIMLEQVPFVLPVWERYAQIIQQAHGYSVWTGILKSERYGVPQARRRAGLIARLDGKQAGPPPATHSTYYERDPSKLDEGVLPWVSMAQALGWGTTGRPSFTVCGGGTETGGAEPYGRRARESLLAYRNGNQVRAAVRDENLPAPTVHFGEAFNDVRWVQRSNYSSRSGKSVPSPVPGSPPLGARELHEPSSTVTSKSARWAQADGSASLRVTVEETAILQSFPEDHVFAGKLGKRYLQVGNAIPPLMAGAILDTFL